MENEINSKNEFTKDIPSTIIANQNRHGFLNINFEILKKNILETKEYLSFLELKKAYKYDEEIDLTSFNFIYESNTVYPEVKMRSKKRRKRKRRKSQK